ncbi:MAG: 1-deoxy-D-xylulose-5-phosphate reductoisomerase, partial [Bacteroidales bacterium]|nr:1-deoxy-D-xylulose-5-phosphate reductoisomerase [Bacteroidales bacterium]
MEKRRIAILGSTGSIGTQALDSIRQNSECFEVELLTANTSAELLISQAIEFRPNAVVICDESRYEQVRNALEDYDIKVWTGIDAVCDILRGDNIDIVLTAMVGFSGLRPTMAAIESGKVIALANKETLVAAGKLVTEAARRYNAAIIPVDSEHSAIFQCLQAAGPNRPERILLTASGGPFRTWEKDAIRQATREQALKHPNWSMGAKITVDSASMVNKGLEIMEARWLFDMPED